MPNVSIQMVIALLISLSPVVVCWSSAHRCYGYAREIYRISSDIPNITHGISKGFQHISFNTSVWSEGPSVYTVYPTPGYMPAWTVCFHLAPVIL